MTESAVPSCGDFSLRIGHDGTWYYHDSPIRRIALAKLFSTVLRREEDGSYWLVTPAERGRILVEDVPFVAVEVERVGTGRDQILTFRTNLDDKVVAGESHPLRVAADGAPYILVRGALEARLARAVFYELVELGREETIGGTSLFGVWSDGKFFPLGDLTAVT